MKIKRKRNKISIGRNLYCSNCHRLVHKQDVYCKYCGVSVNTANYKPDFESVAVIYGPPPRKRVHRCEGCGFEWTTFVMVDQERHCPHCGKNAPIVSEND